MIKIKSFASSSKGNMYIVSNEQTKILLECGVEKKDIINYLISEKLLITDFNACLISHIHADHSKSYKFVSDYIDTYSTIEFAAKCNKIKSIAPLMPFKIGTIKIVPIPVEHGMTENNAFVFIDKDSCVFFGTDFSVMQQNVSNFKFNQICIECNYDDELLQEVLDSGNEERKMKYIRQCSTHLSRNNCILHLSKMDLSKCEEIMLLHPSMLLLSKLETIDIFEKTFNIKTIFAKEK